MIPLMLILKALVSASDLEIFQGLVQGEEENTFLTDRVELLLRGFKNYGLKTGKQCLEYLGSKFRVVLGLPDDWEDEVVGHWLINKVVLVHLDEPRDKFRMLLYVFNGVLQAPPFAQRTPFTLALPGSCSESYTLWFPTPRALITLILLNTKRFYSLASFTE